MRQTTMGRAQAASHDGGFTLVELMAAMMVIGVLLAIAVPTFFGVQSRAEDRSAQSSLRNGLTAAKSLAADGGDFATAAPAELSRVEPGLTFVQHSSDSSRKANQVSVNTTSSVFYAAALSDSGACFYIEDDALGTHFATALAADDCSGDGAVSTIARWSDKW